MTTHFSSALILLHDDLVHQASGFLLALLTGDTLGSPNSLAASRSMTFLTSWQLGGDRDVLGLPLWVAPGLVAELQLLTVPFSNCFSYNLLTVLETKKTEIMNVDKKQIYFLDGTRAPGNFVWKAANKSAMNRKLSLRLWYSRTRKFRCAIES